MRRVVRGVASRALTAPSNSATTSDAPTGVAYALTWSAETAISPRAVGHRPSANRTCSHMPSRASSRPPGCPATGILRMSTAELATGGPKKGRIVSGGELFECVRGERERGSVELWTTAGARSAPPRRPAAWSGPWPAPAPASRAVRARDRSSRAPRARRRRRSAPGGTAALPASVLPVAPLRGIRHRTVHRPPPDGPQSL